MYPWPFVHFLSFVFYSLLAGFVLYKGFRSPLNRLCAAVLACFAVWGFGAIALHDNRVPLETVSFMTKIQSIGWFSFGAFGLWFALVFADRRFLLKRRWLLVPLLGLPLVFIYQQWVNEAVVDSFVRQPYGWDARWSDGPWPWLYYLYYTLHLAGMIYLFQDRARHAPRRVERTQASVLLLMTVLPLIFGTMTNVVLPRAFGYYRLAAMGDLITLFFVIGIVHITVRHHFMAISPATAAENIIATIHDALLLLDAEGRILHANCAACRLLGYSEKGLRNKPFSSFLSSRGGAPDVMERILRGIEVRNEETAFDDRGGKAIPVLLTTSRLVDRGGEQAGTVCTARDITKRKIAEQALSAAKDDLEKQNVELRALDRMKDSFVRAVSHELKTPVAKHFMHLEMLRPLLDKHPLSEQELRAFRVMEESVHRQQQVIRNLLDLSRLESGQVSGRIEEILLDGLLREVVEDYRYALDSHGMEILFDVSPLGIRSDREMLWHVFSNLVGNAIKFRDPVTPKLTVSVRRDEGGVLAQLKDNGIGIDGKDKEKLFTSFFQGTSSTEGSGVGLTICRMIVEGLGGKIWMESEGRGRGATVCVHLPAAAPSGAAPSGAGH
jgi:PAS domain S-box-containing protein